MDVLITYDINRRHTEVKQDLQDAGFLDFWTDNNNTVYNLPNTTLWIKNINSTQQAKNIFDRAIVNLNAGQPPNNIIRIERFMAVQFLEWAGITGNPH